MATTCGGRGHGTPRMWGGQTHPSKPLPHGRDGESLPRHQGPGIHAVGGRDRVDHDARIAGRREPGGDRPQGVPGPDHVRPGGLAIRPDRRPRPRWPQVRTGRLRGLRLHRMRPAASGEHVFDPWTHDSRTGVRCQEENRTYVCIPSRWVVPSPHPEAPPSGTGGYAPCLTSLRGSSASSISSSGPSVSAAIPLPSARSATPSASRPRRRCTPSWPTSSARGSCGRTRASQGR